MIDNSADALALINAEGRTLYCSAATERILVAPHETWGCSIFEFVHDDEFETVARAFEESLASERKQIKVRTRLQHETGSWLWVEVVLNNLLNVDAIQAILINFRDITDAVKAEEEARKSNERFFRVPVKPPGDQHKHPRTKAATSTLMMLSSKCSALPGRP